MARLGRSQPFKPLITKPIVTPYVSTSLIKVIDDLAQASVKVINGLAMALVKVVNGLTNV